MIATGRNTFEHLYVESNKRQTNELPLVDPPVPINLNYDEILDFSIGCKHSVYVTKEGQIYACGDDRTFFIGTKKREIYHKQVLVNFEQIRDKFISAKCGQIYTVYLTQSGIVLICSEKSIHYTPSIHTFECPIVYISGGYLSPVAIDSRGDFYIFSKNPSLKPRHIHLNEPVYDICRCSVYAEANDSVNQSDANHNNIPLPSINKIKVMRLNSSINQSHLPPINSSSKPPSSDKYKLKVSFTVVVTVNGKLFANGSLNNDSPEFSEVYSMYGIHVKKIYGYCGHCIAISDDGRVYSAGDNSHGQLGDGTTQDKYEFTCISSLNNALSNEKATEASVGDSHSLIITESGKLIGFGSNAKNQLFTIRQQGENVLIPTEINLSGYIKDTRKSDNLLLVHPPSPFENKVTFAWCGNSASVALIGKKPPVHLGFDHFFGGREALGLQIRRIRNANIDHMEKQIEQLKKEVQLEKDQNSKLLQENQMLQKNSQQISKPINEKMRKRMEMKLCDIFNENDNLIEENRSQAKEIEDLKKENEKLRLENERLEHEIKNSISLSEYEKEYNHINNENNKLRKELNEKNKKVANLMNLFDNANDVKFIKIAEPTLPKTNFPSRHAVRTASSAKAIPSIKKPLIPNKK